MSEDVKVHFENIPINEEAPPDYSNPNFETSANETNVVVVNQQSEPARIDSKQSRFNNFKRQFPIFISGFILCVIVFLILKALSIGGSSPSLVSENPALKCGKRLIGYYKGYDSRKITEQQIEKLTHIIFNGINTEKDGRVQFHDDNARFSFLDMKNKARVMKSDVKIMFSTDHHSSNQARITEIITDSKTRKQWVDSVSAFIVEQQIDGVELDYSWPYTDTENENYLFFVRELRYKFERMEKLTRRKTPYIISIAAPPLVSVDEESLLIQELLDYADFLNIKTENYYGPWQENGKTGPCGPLYSTNSNYSIDWTLKKYACKAEMASRLNFVILFTGATWVKVNDHLSSTDAVYRTYDKNPDASSTLLWTPWRKFKENGWNMTLTSWHNASRTPYIWDSENRKLFTFENERSLIEKMKYAKEKNIGGVSIDHVEFDDDLNTLLNSVTSVDMCSGEKFEKDEIRYECGNSNSGQTYYIYNSAELKFNFLIIFVLFFFNFI
ncbi:hypothetical protein GCK72_000761 [Caenorhabditis remanei]|uniref:GH18 domain-containing protein n=1 Tax=Caenorhabditis remanei TaxID=31234 RepID=A0A6A5HM12_CAERE|nr:hypothetical protein GCK72_000761 [Caenorhabditis remanei]KAF1768948.1 hypothetical protein GCK72_000761 [Caenorhabditis remanei]